MLHYLSVLKNYVFFPNKDSLSFGNIVFFVVCLCGGSLIGSAVSIYVICGLVSGAWHLMWRNIALPKSAPVLATALAFASYPAAEALASLVNPGPGNLTQVVEDVPFFGILPLFAVIFADREQLLSSVEKGAAAAGLFGYGLFLAGMTEENGRTELFGGNASVLAVLATVLLGINCVAAIRHYGQKSSIYLFSAVACVGLILATGTRGMLPGLLLIPLAAVAALGGVSLRQMGTRGAAVIAVALLGVGAFSYKALEIRAVDTSNEISAIEASRYDTSIGQRLLLWRVGYEMFAHSPVTGAGPGNAQALMPERTRALSGLALSSSHFHNAIINEMARAGLIGLTALLSMFAVPFVVCGRAAKDDIAKAGFALLCGVQAAYLLSGLTGIMLGHDILDTVYICAVVFALYLVFPDPGRSEKLRRR